MDLEAFLFSFNKYIEDFAFEFACDLSEKDHVSSIFIIGLQRSGTTLLYQTMAKYFRIGYPNNLIARFWMNPCVGIRLSQSIMGTSKAISFRSEFGNTYDITDPHEFGHFWKHWMRRGPDDRDALSNKELNTVDWDGLRSILSAMGRCFRTPVVYKQLMLGFQAHRLSLEIPDARFIYIQRPLWEVACSTLKVRRQRYRSNTVWFGLKPPNYASLINLSPFEQIAEQVKTSHTCILQQVSKISSERICSISFQDLCQNPMEQLIRIRNQFELEFDLPSGIQPAKREQQQDYLVSEVEILTLQEMLSG